LRPLKLLVTKVSAEVGFCRLFSHCSTYSVTHNTHIDKNELNVEGYWELISHITNGTMGLSMGLRRVS
jgi:hypothetical protein